MPKLKLCSVYNKKYGRVEGAYTSPTVGMMIRDNAGFLARVSPHFEEDLELREIGEFSEDGLTFFPCTPQIVHSWDEYKRPEVPVEKPNK